MDLAIECKSLRPTYPLLLIRVPRAWGESFHQLIEFDPTASIMRDRRLGPPEPSVTVVSVSGENSMYEQGEFVAKAITQVGRNAQGDFVSGDGAVFDKWSQALASADEFVSMAVQGNAVYKYYTLIIPVLVVSDQTLWVADYSEDGKLKNGPMQADEAVLFVGREYSSVPIWYTISHLHIVTKRQIGSFLKNLVMNEEYWKQIFAPARLK